MMRMVSSSPFSSSMRCTWTTSSNAPCCNGMFASHDAILAEHCLGIVENQCRNLERDATGALGGDHPEESLIKGSVAVYSNSGNFTTTIAQYLATRGWGTTTLISSGKDVYIHLDRKSTRLN